MFALPSQNFYIRHRSVWGNFPLPAVGADLARPPSPVADFFRGAVKL
jgi:hypothetical protein